MATTDPTKLPGQPVDPAQAQGAQIPLQTFDIPEFAPSARGLKALTLTSDIKVDDYQSTLLRPYSIPPLPTSIESLTLELFSLGYPTGFLAALAERSPNLKSVVLYSQLFAGVTKDSNQDAVAFFKRLQGLRALHLLDVFAQPNFFSSAATWLKYNTSDAPGEARRGLMFLEVNYTFRHDDDDFMAKIQATELPLLIGPGLISCSLNLSEPDSVSDGAPSEEGNQDGIMAFNQSLAAGLVSALTDEETYPRGLRALNTTLYTVSLTQLARVLERNRNIMVLQVTVDVEPGEAFREGLLAALNGLSHLEQVEIVAHPTLPFFMEIQDPNSQVMAKTFPRSADMEELSKKCEKLASFKANVLRTTRFGAVDWQRKDGKWQGGAR